HPLPRRRTDDRAAHGPRLGHHAHPRHPRRRRQPRWPVVLHPLHVRARPRRGRRRARRALAAHARAGVQMTPLSATLAAAEPIARRLSPSAQRVAESQWEQRAEWLLFAVVDLGVIALAAAFGMCLWRFVRGPTLV